MTGVSRKDTEQRVLQALAEVDPLETKLDLASRLDEYGLEAGEIERKLYRGEPLKQTVENVFRETCEFELEPEMTDRIVGQLSQPE